MVAHRPQGRGLGSFMQATGRLRSNFGRKTDRPHGTNPPASVSGPVTHYHEFDEVATASRGASQKIVGRNFNWIWFLGAAVWFLDAALGMHKGALRSGLTAAAISGLFLAVGIFFRRQDKRHPGRGNGR